MVNKDSIVKKKRDDNINNSIFAEILLTYRYKCIAIKSYNLYHECAICKDSMKDKYVIQLECKHTFHRNCILNSILNYNNMECIMPLCEKKLTQLR